MAAVESSLLTPASLTAVILSCGLIALGYAILYRLYLSPLARFPGPKLAACSKAYQFYFDVIKRGKLPWELIRLHESYGPIIRIGPNELHVSDPEFYDVLYAGGAHRRDKDIFAIDGFGLAQSVIASANHDVHRMRRAALNPFFSTQSVTKLEPAIASKIQRFGQAFEDAYRKKVPLNLEVVILALTTDVISEYAFAKSYGFLERPGYAPEWAETLTGAAESSMLFRYVPFVVGYLKALPPQVVKMIDPKLLQLFIIKSDQEKQIQTVMDSRGTEKDTSSHKTIFHELLENDSLPPAEKTLPRLTEEAQIVLTAGSTTTVHYLKSTVYFVLADKAILHRLQVELKEAIPNPSELPPMHILERLPYLNAVFKEGSRLNDGASTRLARIAPNEDLKFRDHVIPRGTAVSMSTYIQHRNTSLFPDPETFNPDRWLGPDSAKLERYLVNFNKGTRNCLGMNLAKAEIYLTLAMVFRSFEMELFETGRARDVDMSHDFFVPYASLDSKGIRVTVTGLCE